MDRRSHRAHDGGGAGAGLAAELDLPALRPPELPERQYFDGGRAAART